MSCERRTYDGSSKKKSLFAQQFDTFKKQEKLGKEQSEPAASSSADYSPQIISKENRSSIVNVDIKKDPMYETIHEENIQRLKEMGEQKILEEKANLASSLGKIWLFIIQYSSFSLIFMNFNPFLSVFLAFLC